MNFNFGRNPGTLTNVRTESNTLVSAENLLVIIGHMAAAGSSAIANEPIKIENYGDPDNAKIECDALFGATAELTEMIVAAIKANKFSSRSPKVYPPITCIPMANADDDLAACLANNIAQPMPFVVIPYAANHSTISDFRAHVEAISASDRGGNGQFGSFGFTAMDVTLATITPITEALASKNLIVPWLRDGEAAKANKLYEVAAAYAAVRATTPYPFKPSNNIEIGGLNVPAKKSDWHTTGQAGSIELGLVSGAVPLYVNDRGNIAISRCVTTLRTDSSTPDSAFFDSEDWQKLYYYRKNCYLISELPRYSQEHATDVKLLNLKSEFLAVAKKLEGACFQHVDKLAGEFTVERPVDNRSAAVFTTPVNVIPGFHNRGIDIVGTDKFDVLTLS